MRREHYLPNDLIEVTSGGSRVCEGEANDLLGVNYEDRADL